MTRYTLALCIALMLGASGTQAADKNDLLVPEGEPETILEGVTSSSMHSLLSVAFSPDGRTLASGSVEYSVRLWDITTGRELRRIGKHWSNVLSLAFSPNGRTIATLGEDHTVRLWDVATGRELRSLECSGRALSTPLAFSPDGHTLAAGVDSTIRSWEVETGRELQSIQAPQGKVFAIAFSPAGRTLAVAAAPDQPIYLLDFATGRVLWSTERPLNFVTCMAFSPDGHILASCDVYSPVQFWDAATGRALLQLEGHTDMVRSLAFSPDGRTIASGAQDRTVRLWDTSTGRELRRMEDPAGSVVAVAFSPDGRTIASGGGGRAVNLWDTVTGKLIRSMTEHSDSIDSVAFSAAGDTILSAGQGTLRFWNVPTGRMSWQTTTPLASFAKTSFGHSEPAVALNFPENTIQLLRVNHWNEPKQFKGHTSSINAVTLSPDGQTLASGSEDTTVRLWDVATGGELHRMEKHTGPVLSVAFSPDGHTVASGGADNTVRLWNVSTGRELHRMEKHSAAVLSVAFSPDGRILASGARDNTVRLWDVATGAMLRQLDGHTGPVSSIAFSPNGRVLASGSGDKTVRIWEIASGRELQRLEGHADWVTSVAFGPDENTLASGDVEGTVRIWSPLRDKPLSGLLRGGATGWMGHVEGQPVFRRDDGHFLYHSREDGTLEPVLPPQPDLPPHLSARATLRNAPGDFGDAGEFVITLSNDKEAGRAYWLRVESAALPPGLVLLPPAPIMQLEPGDSVELPVGLSYLRPENAPIPQDPKILLRIIHAFGDGPTVELPLQLLTPQLELTEGPLVEDDTLSVTFKNTGTQPIGPLLFKGDFQVGELKQPGALQKFSIEPGQERSLLFEVPPPFLKAGKFAFALKANYEKWPRTWTFSASEVKVPTAYGLYSALVLGVLLLYSAVHHARVYRNPMVVHALKSPTAIRSYSLEDMIAADHALRRAKRRDSTITAAGIPVTRWERALSGAKTPRDAANAFADAIGGRLGASLTSNSWALSLPPLRLRFAREGAVVAIDGTRLESGNSQRIMADIFQEGRGPGQVIVLDRTHAQNARQVLENVPRVRSVVFSAYRLRDLLLGDEPVRLLETTISEQVAISELSPYQVAGGVKLENLFFGRERELRAIADRAMRNFLVVGQRQMGKSSLLLAVLRRLQARSDVDVCYVELADGDLHRRLARERERVPADGAHLPPFEEIAAGVLSRPRVWLIDEADDFVNEDAKIGYPVLQAMRALSEEGRAYFILAGFWDLYRAVVLDEKQPLRNFGEHLRLEPLDQRSALALVTEPMTALSIQWDAPSTPEFLVEQAGRRANLLVLSCKAMVESLPPDTHVLTREHLERAFREDKDLRDQGRRWRGDHPLHRAVVRQALLLGRPKREEVLQALKARGADIRSADFDEAMDHRELSYVLVPDGEGCLYCPVPLMQRYIESERSLEVGLAEDLEDLHHRGLAEVPRPA